MAESLVVLVTKVDLYTLYSRATSNNSPSRELSCLKTRTRCWRWKCSLFCVNPSKSYSPGWNRPVERRRQTSSHSSDRHCLNTDDSFPLILEGRMRHRKRTTRLHLVSGTKCPVAVRDSHSHCEGGPGQGEWCPIATALASNLDEVGPSPRV